MSRSHVPKQRDHEVYYVGYCDTDDDGESQCYQLGDESGTVAIDASWPDWIRVDFDDGEQAHIPLHSVTEVRTRPVPRDEQQPEPF